MSETNSIQDQYLGSETLKSYLFSASSVWNDYSNILPLVYITKSIGKVHAILNKNMF